MKYDRERHEFVLFCVMTKEEKLENYGYFTDVDFAKAYGIPHSKSLSEWKKEKAFKKAYKELLLDRLGKKLPDVLSSLESRAIEDRDVAAIKEVLRASGLITDKLEIVSTEDIKDVIEKVVHILQEELEDQPTLLNRIADRLEEEIDM